MFNKDFLLIIPVFFLFLYCGLGYFVSENFVYYFKPFIIPSFTIYFFLKYKFSFGVNFYLFAILFYSYELLILYSIQYPFLIRLALINSIFLYLVVIRMIIPTINNIDYRLIVERFTLVIVAVNCLFLLLILNLLHSSVNDNFINFIIIFNAMIAVVLGVSAVSNLQDDGDKKAFFFFFGSFTLILSDVFGSLNAFFYESFYLNLFENIFHFLSFGLLFLFTITQKKSN